MATLKTIASVVYCVLAGFGFTSFCQLIWRYFHKGPMIRLDAQSPKAGVILKPGETLTISISGEFPAGKSTNLRMKDPITQKYIDLKERKP